MKTIRWMSFFLFFPVLSLGSDLFGTGLNRIAWTPSCSTVFDFNGDAIADSLILFRATDKLSLKKNCHTIGIHDAVLEAHNQLILGLLLSNKPSSGFNAYVVHNEQFFSSPIWHAAILPITTICTVKEVKQKGLSVNARGSVIVLGTEAGIDIYLYWNGTKILLEEPSEEP